MQRFFAARTLRPLLPTRRFNHSHYEIKYADKLQERARTEGVTLEELKRKIKEVEKPQLQDQASSKFKPLATVVNPTEKHGLPPAAHKQRKDSSPVKPLTSILNVSRILATPHTADQVSALWTAYHMSRSEGTGRGFVCASILLETYKKMEAVAKKYPTFVVPVPRTRTNPEDEVDTAYEFYYLQWDFHQPPLTPTAADDIFSTPQTSKNPPISTVLFTPLQEYKSRQTFATPYLALTHYTDLAETHGIVLLRGEITPSSKSMGLGTDGKYMLAQNDAQLLSMAVQKFYLWDTENNEECRLLKQFHKEPLQFRWEDLVKRGSSDF